jgi:hypothetical protein
MTTSIERPADVIRRDPLSTARESLAEAAALDSANALSWSMNLFGALRKLSKVFEEHVSESESTGGVLPEMLTIKPHLQKRVRTLKQDHEHIRLAIREAMAAVEEQVCSPAIDRNQLRHLAGGVVREVRRHETKGNDLVYEALLRVDGFD